MNFEKFSEIVIGLSKCHAGTIFDNINHPRINFEQTEEYKENFTNKHNNNVIQYVYSSWEKFSSRDISREDIESRVLELFENKQKIWISVDNVLFIKKENKYVPTTYDVLKTIYENTDFKERQKFFQKLIWIYYENLQNGLQEKNVDIKQILSSNAYEEQVKKLLPIVKFDLGVASLNKSDFADSDKKRLFKELVECLTFPKLLREDCYKILENSDDGEYDYFEFIFSPNTKVLGNLAEYYRLQLSVSKGDHVVCYQFFAKCPSADKEDTTKIAFPSFEKEVFFYKKFIPGLQEENLADFAPKCYFVRRNDLLVLEDLTDQSFVAADIREPGNFSFFSQCIQDLSKLHAGSIILEEKFSKKNGKIFRFGEEYKDIFKESFYYKDNLILSTGCDYIVDYFLEKFPEVSKHITMEEFKTRARDKFQTMFNKVQKSNKYRNVVCHGDLCANNILFKQESEINLKSYLIDFRLIRYCPPSIDLLNFIYINTYKEFRDLYADELINIYKINLAKHLRKCQIDFDKIFPEDSFEKSIEDNILAAVCVGLIYNQVLSIPQRISPFIVYDDDKENDFYVNDRRELYEEALNDDVFKSRMKGLIEDLYDICIKQ